MNTYQIPYTIRLGLPGCHTKAGESQTNLSLALRVTSCAIGCLGILAGAIIAAGILRSVPTACGWSLVVGGSCVSLMAIALKMTKKQTINPPSIADPVLPGAAQSIPVSNAIPLCPENEQQQQAALSIQRTFRRFKAGKVLKTKQNEKQQKKVLEQRLAAAIQIQTLWRGHVAKRTTDKLKRTFLRFDEIRTVLPYINNKQQLCGIQRAECGKTPVYLLIEPPLVLKQSGHPENTQRLLKMQQARAICERNNYQCLTIPKARTYRDFIVESRLPITLYDTKKIMGLYYENRQQFSQAVSEFTGFLCQSNFDDITGDRRNPYAVLAKTPIGRYDNIALYMKEGKGKIGLIDLEQFTPLTSLKQSHYWDCTTALHLFPYHLEEIIQAAKKFDPNIETHRKDLEETRNESLKRFQLTYINHQEFIQRKGIPTTEPLQLVPLTNEHREQIKVDTEQLLTTEHTGTWFPGCLGDNPTNALASFSTTVLPQMLEFVYTIIQQHLADNMEKYKDQPSLSMGELLHVRTLWLGSDFTVDEGTLWTPSLLNMLMLDQQSTKRKNKHMFNRLMGHLFQELANCDMIAYYNASLTCGAGACLFC